MNNKLRCEIVQDLLPSYVDGLTSEVTNEAVEGHLENCRECREKERRMREPEECGGPQNSSNIREIDYLKKWKTRTRWKVALGVFCAIAAVAFLFVLRFFIVGTETSAEYIGYSVEVDDNVVYIKGFFMDSASGCNRVLWKEEDGVVSITVKSALKSIFNKNEFEETYQACGQVREVWLGNLLIWEDGTKISRDVARVYASKHLYIGDASANGRVAEALRIKEQLGSFNNQLQTSEEPYGWMILLEEEIPTQEEDTALKIMTSDACMMLAVVENLGYVTWDYDTQTGHRSYTLTLQEAVKLAGRDIKECAQSASALQELMRGLAAQ